MSWQVLWLILAQLPCSQRWFSHVPVGVGRIEWFGFGTIVGGFSVDQELTGIMIGQCRPQKSANATEQGFLWQLNVNYMQYSGNEGQTAGSWMPIS